MGRSNKLFYLIFPFSIIQSAGAFVDLEIFRMGSFGFRRDLIIVVYAFINLFLSKKKHVFTTTTDLFIKYLLFIWFLY